MKFRFVGGLDCPDWILREITSLSKLSVIKFKHWCGKCVEKLLSEKEWNNEQIHLLDPDFSYDVDNIKAMIAALSFIFEKAGKCSCSPGDLELEMQQLGLPAEHCKQLFKVYSGHFEALQKILSANIKKAPSLTPLSGVLLEGEGKEKYYLLEFTSESGEEVSIAMDENKLNFLCKELNGALQLMSKYTQNV